MDDVRSAYEALNIGRPRRFQEAAWQSITKGANTIISAGTGSGKTEAALLPALATGRRIIALYPTKALLQDQLLRVRHLAGDNAMIAVDTGDEDDKAFYRADVILTSLDKFLYRFFGYGKKRWSYLPDEEGTEMMKPRYRYRARLRASNRSPMRRGLK
jgi:CRISPR-associated endonuclease/helicase Cas3